MADAIELPIGVVVRPADPAGDFAGEQWFVVVVQDGDGEQDLEMFLDRAQADAFVAGYLVGFSRAGGEFF